MPSLMPWPVLTLRLEGGPDDGEVRLVPAGVSVVPPARLEPSIDAQGAYVRHPETVDGMWRYRWEAEQS